MELSEDTLQKLSKDEIVSLALDLQNSILHWQVSEMNYLTWKKTWLRSVGS